MIGRICLHHHMTGLLAATGAPSDLRDQLERALGRPEVREMQGAVGIDDSNQQHIRKVQALGDHLRPEQYIDSTFAKLRKDTLVTAGLAHRVAIHSCDRCLGKTLLHFDF